MCYTKLPILVTALAITILIYFVGLVPDCLSVGVRPKPIKPLNPLVLSENITAQKKHFGHQEYPDHLHPPHLPRHKHCYDNYKTGKKDLCVD